MKKFLLLGLLPGAVLAQSEPAYTLPTEVTGAINTLQSAGTSFASALLPMVVTVGLAFAGVGLALVAFRWFARSRNAGR